jgi:nickel-dependent lactate racemase
MKYLLILLFLFSTQGISKEIIWVCPNNYGNDWVYKISNNDVFQRRNKKWIIKTKVINTSNYKSEKIIKKNKIIFNSSYDDNDVYATVVYDLKNVTQKTYSTPKDNSEPSTLLYSMNCKEQ